MPSDDLRRARMANTAIFFLTGATGAAWATRIPGVQDRLDLSPGALGIAVLGLEAGAVVGLPAGGAIVARIGSRRALRLAFAVYPAGLVGIALAPGLAPLALVLAAWAVANSVIDVAMNAQGVELERRSRRPVLARMHAGHSFGLVAGGLAGIGAAAAGVSLIAHFALAATLGVLVGVTVTRWLVVEPRPDGQPAVVRPSGRLLVLGLIAFCAFLLDGAAYNWSAVHLRAEREAGAALAAAAFTCFALTVALGRLVGDRLIARWGRVRVVQGCGALAAAGCALAITVPTPGASLAGWALFGLGLSAIAPAVLGAAPAATAAPPSVAIAAVTTVGYLGSFTGPPLIGLIAELSSLSAALALLVVVSAACALLARPGLRPPSGR